MAQACSPILQKNAILNKKQSCFRVNYVICDGSSPIRTRSFYQQPLARSQRDNLVLNCLRSDVTAISLSVDEQTLEQGPEYLSAEIVRLTYITKELQQHKEIQDKLEFLKARNEVESYLNEYRCGYETLSLISGLEKQEQIILYMLIIMGQGHILGLLPSLSGSSKLQDLAQVLLRVENFYDSIGGLIGYHLKSLELICAGTSSDCDQQHSNNNVEKVQFHVPHGPDLSGDEAVLGQQMSAHGLQAIPELAEIYPLGGAGDRLGLKDPKTAEPLPAAMLQYCGRSMLDGLIRDVQAKEYLYWCIFGSQVTTPIAIMTSDAKGNHEKMGALMEYRDWYGRGKDSFRLFSQPLVPVVGVQDGKWLLAKPLEPVLKPGGHGAIWKLMMDSGVFDWLQQKGCKGSVVRQISNPLAATDVTLLALAGTGRSQGHLFGFASCPRVAGAAEGMNVMQEREITDSTGKVGFEYGVSNVEYTEFERLGVQDEAVDDSSGLSKFPANTNVLYVDINAAREAVEEGIRIGGGATLPGMIFNMKKIMKYNDAFTNKEEEVLAGRMECTMQNLVDSLVERFDRRLEEEERAQLQTFVVFNQRRKVTSSAKRARKPNSTKIHQTPEGSFRDLMLNAHELLTTKCGISQIPEVGDVQYYLDNGPGFIFLFHPALGPLWQVIGQKIEGGKIHPGSEIQLEVAWLRWQNVQVKGSLLVRCTDVLGKTESWYGQNGVDGFDKLVYSHECGRVRLENVVVHNAGIDWKCKDNVYWKHKVSRKECLEIELKGNAEFEAIDVTFSGKDKIIVEDGTRLSIRQDPKTGKLLRQISTLEDRKPSWWYSYHLDQQDGSIQLSFQNQPAQLQTKTQ